MKYIIMLVAAFITNVGLADTNYTTGSIDDTLLQKIAIKALHRAFDAPNGDLWEHGGFIFIRNGRLGWNLMPATLGRVDATRIDPDVLLADGDEIVGQYHTHPCMPETHYPQLFSPSDLIAPFFYKVPTFILDECSGNVHEFDPKTDDPHATGKDVFVFFKCRRGIKKVHLTSGRIVGNIGVIGKNLDDIPNIEDQEEPEPEVNCGDKK